MYTPSKNSPPSSRFPSAPEIPLGLWFVGHVQPIISLLSAVCRCVNIFHGRISTKYSPWGFYETIWFMEIHPTSEIDIDCVKINASLIMFAKPFVRKKKLSHVPLSFLIENYHLHKLTFSEKLRLVELTCDINWDLTKSSEILQDLLRSHKIYWELKRYRFGIWHLAFGIWQLICDMWHVTLICHDIILYNDINTIPIHFLWWILRLSQ